MASRTRETPFKLHYNVDVENFDQYFESWAINTHNAQKSAVNNSVNNFKINEPWFSVFSRFSNVLHTHFCISSTFISNTKLKLAKEIAKAKQRPEAELLLFEDYLLSSSTLSSKSNRAYSGKCAKKQVCLFVYFNEIIWLIITKGKRKSRSYKYDINRPTFRHGLTYTNKHKKCLSTLWWW